jgi:branched-chain amino acid transport system substrate-binding protein
MRKGSTAVITLVAAASLVAAACGGEDDGGGGGKLTEGETFTVGYAASQTGRLAIFEEPFLKGLEAEINEINSGGGIDGKVKIDLQVQDCASDPQRCGVVAQDLIDQGAQFLISPCDVDASLPAAQIAQRDQIPILNSCGSASSFRDQVGEFAFLNVYGTEAEGQAMAEFAHERGYETAGMMTSSDIEYTESIIDSATTRFEELGGQVVETQQFKLDQPRYTSQATALANSNPDVVMTSMFLPGSNTFLQALRSAGYKGPVIGGDGVEGQETFAAGDAASDVFAMTFGYPGTGPGDATDQFYRLYEQEHGQKPDLIIAALGGDAAVLIDEAVEAAGSTDPVEVRNALDSLSDVVAPTGSITYAGQDGVPAKDVVILETNVPEKQFDFVDRFVPEAVQESADD